MNAMDFSALIGLHYGDSGLNELLKQFGKKLKFEMDDTQLAYLEYRKYGFCLYFEEQETFKTNKKEARDVSFVVKAIMFYAEGYESYKAFQGDLPFNIDFSDSRKEIQKLLGEPIVQGGGGRNTFTGGFWPEWDEYRQKDCKITFQYNENKSGVNLVTTEKIGNKS